MKKTALVLLILVIGVFGLLLSRTPTQGQQADQQDSDDEPTVIKKGQPKTKKEKEYSKEYKKLYPSQDKKLNESIKLAKEKGYKGEIGSQLGVPSFITLDSSPTAAEFLKNLVCKSDAVVLGSTKNKTAHLTEEETWVYTEYDFLVKDILKNNLVSFIRPNAEIQITRSGGAIKLDNYVFRVKDELYEPLKKNKDYLLFLQYVPTADGYIVADFKGDFILNGKQFKSLSKVGLPEGVSAFLDYQTLLNIVRDSNLACVENSKGGR